MADPAHTGARSSRVATPVRIVLVDDHRLFRDGLKRLLAGDERFEVAGEAASGEEFLELLAVRRAVRAVSPSHYVHAPYRQPKAEKYSCGTRCELHYSATPPAQPPAQPFPDVIFMDIDMPGGMNGIEASRRALELWPDAKIIALSMHGEQEYYLPMVELGVKGFLLKNSEFGEVAAAAETVARGGTYFSPELMASLVKALTRSGELPKGETLSERETEVLPLVCEGLSNHEIAEKLFISKRTVDKHRANILAKTGCKNTASLVIYAVRNNLITI